MRVICVFTWSRMEFTMCQFDSYVNEQAVNNIVNLREYYNGKKPAYA